MDYFLALSTALLTIPLLGIYPALTAMTHWTLSHSNKTAVLSSQFPSSFFFSVYTANRFTDIFSTVFCSNVAILRSRSRGPCPGTTKSTTAVASEFDNFSNWGEGPAMRSDKDLNYQDFWLDNFSNWGEGPAMRSDKDLN